MIIILSCFRSYLEENLILPFVAFTRCLQNFYTHCFNKSQGKLPNFHNYIHIFKLLGQIWMFCGRDVIQTVLFWHSFFKNDLFFNFFFFEWEKYRKHHYIQTLLKLSRYLHLLTRERQQSTMVKIISWEVTQIPSFCLNVPHPENGGGRGNYSSGCRKKIKLVSERGLDQCLALSKCYVSCQILNRKFCFYNCFAPLAFLKKYNFVKPHLFSFPLLLSQS